MKDLNALVLAGALAIGGVGTLAYAQDNGAAEAEEAPSAADLAREEAKRLKAEYDLLVQRQKTEMVEMELEKQRLAAEAELRKLRQAQQTAALKEQLEAMQGEAQLRKAQEERALADARSRISELKAQRELEDLRRSEEIGRIREQVSRMSAENEMLAQTLKRAELEASRERAEYETSMSQLRAKLSLREKKDEVGAVVLDDVDYQRNPFQDGTLHITDRRISLNGAIISGTAEYVTDRIHYFNNRSNTDPIFIVIDNCPGGSVMEGYRIVQAMRESPAPVHVVVKSFAASMAAVITTLADHSYAYPNAIILHHQMSYGMGGNMTEHREQLESAEEWSRRLAEPVAAKMGVGLDRFVELMYENNSAGDWEEFADEARRLRWVNDIVTEIRESGLRERPEGSAPTPWFWWQTAETDDNGNAFRRLPPLRPFDFYFIHNPNDFYRW